MLVKDETSLIHFLLNEPALPDHADRVEIGRFLAKSFEEIVQALREIVSVFRIAAARSGKISRVVWSSCGEDVEPFHSILCVSLKLVNAAI